LLVAIYSYAVTNFCTCIFMKHLPGIWPGICGSFSIRGTVGDNTFWLANPEVGMGKRAQFNMLINSGEAHCSHTDDSSKSILDDALRE